MKQVLMAMAAISEIILSCAVAAAVPANSQRVEAPPTHMYWFETLPSFTDFALKRSDLEGNNVRTLTILDPLPTDLVIDVLGQKLYWAANGDYIQRANLDGSGIETIILDTMDDPGDTVGPHSIALDTNRGKIYWTDRSEKTIRRANLDGTQIEDVVTTDKYAEDLQLDLLNDRVYWLDLDTSVNPPHGRWGIRRANLDGTGKLSVVGQFGPSNFTLDPARNSMYWSQYVNDHIYRADLNGQSPQVLYDGVVGIRGPWEMDVNPENGQLYWVEQISGAIRTSGPFGGNLQTLHVGGPMRAFALGIVPEPSAAALIVTAVCVSAAFRTRRAQMWQRRA
jgi:DNA-binding beta-propeller fold protein YncE